MELGPLTENAIDIINRTGKPALTEACQLILGNKKQGIISEALTYYAQEIFPRVLPIFPALINISSALAAGEPQETQHIAAAMLLITASGDIHDDIIDQSTSKFGKKTLYGKYGKDITLLAGDSLLTQGMALIQASDRLSTFQKQAITDSIAKSMFQLVEAEAMETRLWKKTDITPEECFEVIKGKANAAQLHCQIGAILGCADDRTLIQLSEYGRLVGLIATVKDEYVDIYSYSEFKSRVKNEMPPYPVLCAIQDRTQKKRISPILKRINKLTKRDHLMATKLVLDSPNVKQQKIEMQKLVEDHLSTNFLLGTSERGKEAAFILKALATEL